MYVNLGICNDGLYTTEEIKETDPLMSELLFLAEYYSDNGFQAEKLSQDTREHVAPLLEALEDRVFGEDEFRAVQESGRFDRMTLKCLQRYDWLSCAGRFLETAKVDGNFTGTDRRELSLDCASVLGSREGQAQQAFDQLFDSYVAARQTYDRTGEGSDFDWLYSVEQAMRRFVETNGEGFFIDILKRSSRGDEGHVMAAYLLAHIGWTDSVITDALTTNAYHEGRAIREAARYAFQQQEIDFERAPSGSDITLVSTR